MTAKRGRKRAKVATSGSSAVWAAMMAAGRASWKANRHLGRVASFKAARIGAERTRDAWQRRWVTLLRPLSIVEKRNAIFAQGARLELSKHTSDVLIANGWALAADPPPGAGEDLTPLLGLEPCARSGESRPINERPGTWRDLPANRSIRDALAGRRRP